MQQLAKRSPLTYTALHDLCIEWANDRSLFATATPITQHGKTLEELREVADAMAEYPCYLANVSPREAGTPANRLALEFGDVLVTLCLQAHMQGATLAECIETARKEPLLGFSYMPKWVHLLSFRIYEEVPNAEQIRRAIGAIGLCIADQARMSLAMRGEECLELALNKIWGRQGQMVDGLTTPRSKDTGIPRREFQHF